MYTLEKLIWQYCPDGVEYKKLKDCAELKRGTSATRKDLTEGKYPVISGGREPAFYCDTFNRSGENITVAGSGAGAGYVQYWNEPIFVCDAFSVIGFEGISTKYVYYCMSNMQDLIYSTKKGGGVPHVYTSSVENFEIPVPPLPIQEEIVCILDDFTEKTERLKTELNAELTARKEQYKEYQKLLLENVDGETKYVSDVFKRIKGTPITAGKMKEIADDNGEVRIFAGGKTVINAKEADIPNANITRVPSVIVQSRGVIDFIYYDKPFTFKNEMWAYTSEDATLLKYLYYCLKHNVEHFRNSSFGMGAMPQISLPVTEKFRIVIPTHDQQQHIVDILDRFDKLCNDISSGLPAEIEARTKQYEYYRDKLLTFKRLGD